MVQFPPTHCVGLAVCGQFGNHNDIINGVTTKAIETKTFLHRVSWYSEIEAIVLAFIKYIKSEIANYNCNWSL